MPQSVETRLNLANTLASRLGQAKVTKNQLAIFLSHLRRHKNLEATRKLLENLPNSSFAQRTKSTRSQFEHLASQLGPILKESDSWEEAAWILGWAARLIPFYKP